jgi:hypothetical protein
VANEQARRVFPFHPPLFAIFPVLSIYSANLALISASDLWVPLGFVFTVSFVVWAVCTLAVLPWRLGFRASLSRGAAAASFMCGTAVLYTPISTDVTFLQPTYAWFTCILVIAILLGWFVSNPYWPNIIASFMVLSAGGGIVWGEIRSGIDLRKIEYQTPAAALTPSGRPPDIFYIILDGYGRENMLRRVMHFDNSGFIEGLRHRGFYVADQSHSNYVQTEISLGSSLNFNFIQNLIPRIPQDASDRTPFDALISKNSVARFLRDRGYQTISVTSGFPSLKFPHADLWLAGVSRTSLFETTLLQSSPFVDEDRETESMYLWRRTALLGALKNVRDLAAESSQPRFVFVHILAPHPPFVFGVHGERLPHHGPYGYWDGSDFVEYSGTRSDYRNGYVGQVTYLNGEVLKTLDALLASNRRPIVLVQGDHGSKMYLDQNQLRKTDLTECFDNLSAFYVPDDIKSKLYPTITPVNSFRIILSTLFGAKLPNLPDRSWYSPFSAPFHFTDVTKEVTSAPAPLKSLVRH